MKYRTLGRTGLKISEVSLGTEWIAYKPPELIKEVISKAIENGVNYFDIIFNFENYLEAISEAIEGHRDDLVLVHHLTASEYQGRYKKNRSTKSCTETFERYLKTLKTDYVDILLIHFVQNMDDYEKHVIKEDGLLDLALKFKAEGKAKFIGLSTHQLDVVERVAKNGNFDVIMYQINLANNAMDNRNKILALCAQENIGLIAMKPYAGGALLRKKESVGIGGWRRGGETIKKKKIPEIVTPLKCLHYSLSQVGVSAVVPGVANVQQLDVALNYNKATDKEKDYSLLLKEFDEYIREQCVYCNHCQPCSSDIDIGPMFKVYDQAIFKLTEDLKNKYKEFDSLASSCIECGDCEERCPFDVKVIEKMKEVVKLFE
ncbi:MAG: hypothetical protein FK733_07050 [Asgard group archaeon]|nr:hypothetical protein [Asgard group archaeon]